ncbi:hypothetical protein ACWDA8_26150 [Streptomyces sp. NPDC001130]
MTTPLHLASQPAVNVLDARSPLTAFDVLAGVAVGALTSPILMTVMRRRSQTPARWIVSGRLRPLLVAP